MIKNIIFDIGGVLLSYNWKYAFYEAGLDEEHADDAFNKIFGTNIWLDMDKGLYDYSATKQRLVESAPEYAKEIAYFMDHPENVSRKREKVYELVHRLKEKGYGLYILSNYNDHLLSVHSKGCSFWDDIPEENRVVSCRIKMLKPERCIYEYLLKKCSLKACECVFFDDNKPNTDAATECGIKGVHVADEEALISELEQLLTADLSGE